MQTCQALTHSTTEAASSSAIPPARRWTRLSAACAAVAASTTTLLLALAPALLAPSGEPALQGAQLVELPRVVISAHRESLMDGARVDAGRIEVLPRVQVVARREPASTRVAAGEGASVGGGQPVMQRRGF